MSKTKSGVAVSSSFSFPSAGKKATNHRGSDKSCHRLLAITQLRRFVRRALLPFLRLFQFWENVGAFAFDSRCCCCFPYFSCRILPTYSVAIDSGGGGGGTQYTSSCHKSRCQDPRPSFAAVRYLAAVSHAVKNQPTIDGRFLIDYAMSGLRGSNHI